MATVHHRRVVITGNASRNNVPNKTLLEGTFVCASLDGNLRDKQEEYAENVYIYHLINAATA